MERPKKPVCRVDAPVERPKKLVCRGDAPVEMPKKLVCRGDAPVEMPEILIRRVAVPVESLKILIRRVAAPVEMPKILIRRVAAPVESPKILIRRGLSTGGKGPRASWADRGRPTTRVALSAISRTRRRWCWSKGSACRSRGYGDPGRAPGRTRSSCPAVSTP